MQLLQNANVKNKTVLVRVDFNVPIEKKKILDNYRIKKALPTINYLIKKKAKILLLSHLGRPKGRRIAKLSLTPVSEELSKILGKKVIQLKDCAGPFILQQVESMNSGDVYMLENVRFYKEEEKNNSFFAKKLASLADIYVNDAFSACHRKHASIVSVPKLIPSYAGLLLQKEIKELNKVLNPEKPFIILLGGAKVIDKLELIKNLASKTDKILIGGAMMFSFWKVKKKSIGSNSLDLSSVKLAKILLKKYSDKLIIPSDVIVADKLKKKIKKSEEVPENWYGLDIGPKTVEEFKKYLKKAKTIFWNGPLGLFEVKPFDKGTNEIAKFLSAHKGTVIVGGGETISAVKKYRDKYGFVSTGGGACLQFLSGKKLPGIEVLK